MYAPQPGEECLVRTANGFDVVTILSVVKPNGSHRAELANEYRTYVKSDGRISYAVGAFRPWIRLVK